MKIMNTHRISVPLFFLLAAIVGLFVASAAHAEGFAFPGGAFIVRPAKAELTIPPGGKKETVFTLANGTQLPLHVDVSFEDIAATAQTNPTDDPVKLLGNYTGAYPLRDLLGAPNNSFDILSGKEVQLPVSITIPKGAEPGGRYGSVVFSFHPVVPPGAPPATNVAIESRVAALFFVRVSGSANEEGKLVAFGLFNNAKTVAVPSALHPLSFQVAYENTGNVHVNPYGRLTLATVVGAPTVLTIDPWVVLPDATRMREVAVTVPLPIGYYTAHLELNRGYRDIIDEQEVSFWILPGPKQAAMIILGVILILWIIRRSLRLSRNFISRT